MVLIQNLDYIMLLDLNVGSTKFIYIGTLPRYPQAKVNLENN